MPAESVGERATFIAPGTYSPRHQFGQEAEKRLREGGCTTYDYIADYAAKFAADAVAKEGAQVFWHDVYSLIRSGKFSEDRALKALDPEGVKRAKYLRPEGFPGCFDEST